jgi:hypothetical protein
MSANTVKLEYGEGLWFVAVELHTQDPKTCDIVISEIFSDSGELPKLASFVAVIYYSLPEGGKLPGSPFI